ncbi:MAG: hypothetical protein ABI361_09510 [Nitrososphaera sp.]|jgi:hypothetical protein
MERLAKMTEQEKAARQKRMLQEGLAIIIEDREFLEELGRL